MIIIFYFNYYDFEIIKNSKFILMLWLSILLNFLISYENNQLLQLTGHLGGLIGGLIITFTLNNYNL